MGGDVVVAELHVAGLEHHVEPHVLPRREVRHQLQRLALGLGQLHPTALRPGLDRVADEAAGDEAARPAEHRDRPRRHAVRVVGGLALRIVEATIQDRQQVGPRPQDLVVHRHGADDGGQPALLRPALAEQPDQVAAIGVEIQPCLGLVAARIGRAIGAALVEDMPQHLAMRVLRHRGAEMRAQPPEDRLPLGLVEAVGRQAAHHEEAAAAARLLQPVGQARGKHGQREIGAGDGDGGDAAGLHGVQGAGQILDLGRGQGADPGRIVGDRRAAPGAGIGDGGVCVHSGVSGQVPSPDSPPEPGTAQHPFKPPLQAGPEGWLNVAQGRSGVSENDVPCRAADRPPPRLRPGGRMAGPARPRRLLPAVRGLRHVRYDLHPHHRAGAGQSGPLPDQPERDAVRRDHRVVPAEGQRRRRGAVQARPALRAAPRRLHHPQRDLPGAAGCDGGDAYPHHARRWPSPR